MIPGITAKPTLDDVQLSVPFSEVEIEEDRRVTVTRLATGDRRVTRAIWGDGLPDIKIKLGARIKWSNTRNDAQIIDAAISEIGPHRLVLWRGVTVSWTGNGQRVDHLVPWQHAPFSGVAMPNEDKLGLHLAPWASTTKTGQSLEVVPKNAADYDAGTPPTGQAWFDSDGLEIAQRKRHRIKLPAPLAADAKLYLAIVPVIQVALTTEVNRRVGVLNKPRLLVMGEF